MLIISFFWTTVIAFLLAKVEINIEGRNGWAKELPTWRIHNGITDFLFSGAPLTGYHFWMFFMIFVLFHYPYFLGQPWNMGIELQLLGLFFYFLIVEDFIWFILNPAYGLKKFNKTHITWHKKWVGMVPLGYVKAYFIGTFFLFAGISLF